MISCSSVMQAVSNETKSYNAQTRNTFTSCITLQMQ